AWLVWSQLARRLRPGRYRETLLSVFGPLSLVLLIVTWGIGLIVGFGLLGWSLALTIHGGDGTGDLGTYIYLSGTTFLTLGYGDATPGDAFGRVLAVIEAGLGFSFLALVIGYLPVFYQALARREALIAMLDARAGSPPTAGEALRRAALSRDFNRL